MIKKIIFLSFIVTTLHPSPTSVTSGGTSNSNLLAYKVLLSGTSTIGAFQQIQNFGDSGTVLSLTRPLYPPSYQKNNYGLKLITTLTASSSATLTFNSTDLATYDVFLIELDNIQPSDAAVTFQAYFSNDNGSSYYTTNYLSGINYLTYNSATITNISSTTHIPLSTAISTYVSGHLYFYKNIPATSGGAPSFMNGVVIFDYPGIFGMMIGYQSVSSVTMNNIKFQFSAGNITQGVIRLYAFAIS